MSDISDLQRSMMTHALGIRTDRPAYRNYFFCYKCSDDERDWDDLCSKGYAIRKDAHFADGGVYFFVTEKGASAIGATLPEK